jgi:hypothetical protein
MGIDYGALITRGSQMYVSCAMRVKTAFCMRIPDQLAAAATRGAQRQRGSAAV